MRIFSIITALLVCAVIYGVVMERDRMVEFAQSFRSAPEWRPPDPSPPTNPGPVMETRRPALPEGTVASSCSATPSPKRSTAPCRCAAAPKPRVRWRCAPKPPV